MSRSDRDLEDAITLVTQQARVQGVHLTRTKLVKLLYFVDLGSWERLGSRVSGVDWIWHHYGPYSGAIVDACERMAENGELELTFTNNYFGSPQVDISSTRAEYYRRPSSVLVGLVRSVVSDLGQFPPAKIGDLSYDTKPMKALVERGGARGDLIEFPEPRPSVEAVHRTAARYSTVAAKRARRSDRGDVAAGLREESAALSRARKSAGNHVLGE
jgi:hypothetical protein